MKREEIYIDDWYRIFIGEVPPEFYLEAIIRIIVIYVILIVSMRLIGKRMASQLTRNELAAIVTLAAAIGIPVQAPDRGLLPAIIIAIIVVIVQRFIAITTFKNQGLEKKVMGNTSLLVEDSMMKPGAMKKSRITRARIVSHLRSKGIRHLGYVKRFYLEAGGAFSVLIDEDPKPGLSLIPDWDTGFEERQEKDHTVTVCCNCGSHLPDKMDRSEKQKCDNCGNTKWQPAIK